MPPKPKKAPTPQGSKAGKSTKSTSSSTNLQTKDHYSIFVLNTQTDGAVSILREFVARAKKRKRNVVVPIVLEEIEKEISLDKAGAKTATSEHAKNDEANNIFSYDATAKEIFQFTQMRITKCIEEHDSFLTQLNSIKKSDLLQYWEESSGTATMSADMKKGAKSVPGKKGSSTTKDTKLQDTKKESKNGKKKKGNETVAEKSEYGDDNCKLEALPAIQLTTKMFSQFSHDIHESRAHQKYITDFPEDGPLLYILIIGSISADLCLDLLREKYPVAAIFSVCPNEEATPESSFQSLSDFLQNNALTKATYLQNLSFPALSKCDAIKESKMIYNELSWLLYDVVTSKRQHTNFLANLKEIDVSMKNFKCKDDIDWSTPKYQTELDIVPLYLNGLLSAVVASIEGTPASSSTQSILNNDSWHPFLQLHTKEIVEYRNYIIKNALSNNGYENLVYRKSLELLSVYGIPALLWRSLDCGSSGQRFSWNPSGNTSRLESKSINVQGPEITYVEIFTKNAMIQRFIELNNSYDFNYVEHCAERDELDVCFYNSDYQYFESCQTFHIPTRVCFRDYCKYVVPDLCEWIEEQELLYDAMLAQESGNQKQTKIIVFDDIIDENYVMQFALKTRADSMEKKKLSKTSMVEMRNLASQFISNEILFDSITAERNILKDSFTVYNIGDTRYQITSTRTKFKTAGGFVQILEDKMTSGEIMLRVDLDYLGERVMYNHTYPSRIDCPSMKISCNNSSTINFRMRPIVSGNKVMTKDALQGLESQFRAFYFDVHSAWPNGLTIRTFYDEATGGIIFVEQKVVVNSKGEIKRVYFPDGKLVIYYNDDFIEVLTPSGVTYEAVRILDADVDQTTSYSDGENSDELKMKQKKFFFELAAFHDLKCEVYKEKFKINTPEGHAFEIFEGSIERENRKQHLTEWNDYALGERYAMLEGGTKTRLSKNNFQVYYQNGTLFTTTTEEESIDENSEQASALGSLQLLGESENERSATAIAGNLVDKILDNVSAERYVSCSRTYLIQHEDYATLFFGRDQVKISCPHETHIILRRSELQIDIKNKLRVNCNPEKCIVRGCKYPDQNNFVEAEFNFENQNEPFLTISSGIDAELTVKHDGTRRYKAKSVRCLPKFLKPPERRIVLNRQLEGYETHSKVEVDLLAEEAQQKKHIVFSGVEAITILQPVELFSERFKMPIVDIEDFLKKFILQGLPCTPFLLPTVAALQQIPDLMTVRVFILATKYFRRLHPSTAEIISMTPSSLDEVCLQGESEQNILRLIKQEAKR